MIDYSDWTFKRLMDRCMSRVADSVDKREGSMIYDAVASAVAELAIAYMNMSTEMDRAFVDTAADVDLNNKTKERGIVRHAASFAVRKGVFTDPSGGAKDIPIGNRFSGGDLNFVAVERIAAGEFRLKCETAGAAGNQYRGILFPIEHIDNLGSAALADVLIPGEDEEDDDSLRARWYDSLDGQAFGGNIADYKMKVKPMQGVGMVKVFPTFSGGYRPADLNVPAEFAGWIASAAGIPAEVKAWIETTAAAIEDGAVTVGAGTVKLVLVDSEGHVPSDELIEAVQLAVDPPANASAGYGTAPIGHRVKVMAAGGRTIDVSLRVTLSPGRSWEAVKPDVEKAIGGYFAELIEDWENEESLVVRISKIESGVLDVAGVVDVGGTTLAGSPENLVLSGEDIPILGAVTNEAA